MPELPEVETVRRGLEPVMTGRTILQAQVNRPDLRFPLPDRMADLFSRPERVTPVPNELAALQALIKETRRR